MREPRVSLPLIIFAGLNLCAPLSFGARVDCVKNPRASLPILVRRAMSAGNKSVVSGLSAQAVGWEAPATELLFPAKDGSGSADIFGVVVKGGKRSTDLSAVSLIFLRSAIVSAKIQNRAVLATSLNGRLQAAIFASNGINNDLSTPATKEKVVPSDPRAKAALDERLRWACGVVSRDELSYQEEIAARLKANRAEVAK